MNNETTIATIITTILALPVIIGAVFGTISTISYMLGKLPGFINKQVTPRICYCFLPVYLFMTTILFYIPVCALSLIFKPLEKVAEAIGRMYKFIELTVTYEWKEANNLPRNIICTHWEESWAMTAKQYVRMLEKNKEQAIKVQPGILAFWITGVIYIAMIFTAAYFTL